MKEKKVHPKQVTINLDEEMFEELRRIANDRKWSLSQTAREELRQSFRDRMILK